jgi:nucleoside-diphosphate-sugar epimerase
LGNSWPPFAVADSSGRSVLVTGASGFVGGALAAFLGRQDWWTVRAASREAHGANTPTDDVEQFVVGDVGPATDWRAALAGVDVVIHAAARVHVMSEKAADPLAAFRAVNTAGTLKLASEAARAGVGRFVFISSIKVLGEGHADGRPYTAADVPRPIDPYGISKFEAEAGLRDLAAKTGMELVILRPPLIYGPGVKGNFLLMMRWVRRGLPLPFGAVGHNRRSLVALDNLVDQIVTCARHPAAANQVFLAGDGEDLSTADLLRRLAEAMKVPARLFPVPVWALEAAAATLGKRELAQRLCGNLQIDISKAQHLLGWRPVVSVDEGLRRAAAGFTG